MTWTIVLPPGTALYKHQHNGNNPTKKKYTVSIKEALYIHNLSIDVIRILTYSK